MDPLVLKALNALGPYIEWVDPTKMLFVIVDEKVHNAVIKLDFIVMPFVRDLFKSAGWVERSEYLRIICLEYQDIPIKELQAELDESIKKGEVYQTNLGNLERWIKLSPKGDFEAVQSSGPPMYM